MKFPPFSGLDPDQRRILGAPPRESILVLGPPGTGKTVAAFFRAAYLQEHHSKTGNKSTRPQVIMYNKVLSKYASKREGDVAKGVASSTMHSWVWRWHKGLSQQPPPCLPSDRFAYDWMKILANVAPVAIADPQKVNFGHLIVDEGQDFPADMYRILATIAQMANGPDGRPAITVFADDNQRMNEKQNSTVGEIEEAMAIPKGRVYLLKKNYRNSRQIAMFARHYFVGAVTGVPDLPDRVGKSKPRITRASDIDAIRDKVSIFAKNNPGMQVGILCSGNSIRRTLYNKVENSVRGTGLMVQTYASGDKVDSMDFDRAGTITILNLQSAKGLEFDAVFIVDPFVDGAGALSVQSKMQLYVMASRARDYLELFLLNPPGNLANFLPPEELYESA